jgi:hypothetical protein
MYVLADATPDTVSNWIPVVLLLIIGIGFSVGNIVASIIIGPSRTGPGKEQTYESGMVPIGDTRRRFNVRFYIVLGRRFSPKVYNTPVRRFSPAARCFGKWWSLSCFCWSPIFTPGVRAYLSGIEGQ